MIAVDSSIKIRVKGNSRNRKPFMTNQAGTKVTGMQAVITDSLLR